MSAMPSFYHFIYSESEIIFQMKKLAKMLYIILIMLQKILTYNTYKTFRSYSHLPALRCNILLPF